MSQSSARQQKAIVVGASSGIGRAIAQVLSKNGYALGLVARRLELLRQLQKELPTQTTIKQIDVSQPEQAMPLLRELIDQMGGIDLIVINAGINAHNLNLCWPGELDTFKINVIGFAAMANVAVEYFLAQGQGHIVGISSIASLRGSGTCTSYNASKAFVANYLQGLRYKLRKTRVYITDIRPGLVDTAMVRGQGQLFWVATPEGAAEQIFQAIKQKKPCVYITRRWNIIAWLIKFIPDCIWCWIYQKRIESKKNEGGK